MCRWADVSTVTWTWVLERWHFLNGLEILMSFTNTRQNCNFRQSSLNLSLCQIVVYSVGIKIFNSLLQRIKNLSDKHEQFKSVLQNYFHTASALI